jgi:hypothetical protein
MTVPQLMFLWTADAQSGEAAMQRSWRQLVSRMVQRPEILETANVQSGFAARISVTGCRLKRRSSQ